MIEILNKILTNKTEYFKGLIIFLTSVILFIASFVIYNGDTVPGRGFESAKVGVIQNGGFIIILLTLLFILFSTIHDIFTKRESELFTVKALGKDFLIFSLLILAITVTVLISPYREIAINGNFFRFQGLNVYLPIFLVSFIIYKSVNFRNWHFISISIILSATIQAIQGFTQFHKLASTDVTKISQGLWVNGFYGQSNFFSSHLLLGIILAAFYLSPHALKIGYASVRYLITIISISVIIVLLIALAFSFSEWGIVTVSIFVVLIILYELIPTRFYFPFFVAISLSFLPVAGAVYFFFPRYELRFEIWEKIRDIMIYENIQRLENFRFTIFGYGFDTLGELFKSHNKIPNLLIDRAHNIVFDIIVQLGLIGFGFFGVVFFQIFRSLKLIINNITMFYIFIAGISWFFKSLINEYSITNFFQWTLLVAIILGLINQRRGMRSHTVPANESNKGTDKKLHN
jgi:hypothetical protein